MHDIVKDYYGKQLQSCADLKTSACCDVSDVPGWLKPVLARIHPAVLDRYYGCGLVCPDLADGARILDLGCGSGRDVYALAQLVGGNGAVVGVDMTREQLSVAEDYRQHHAERFGFDNVSFIEAYIERLNETALEENSFDLVVSNCVLNLSPDKGAVLRGVYRLLKEGGEFYFSDVYADRRLPPAVREDPVLYGECLGGALYWKDFLRLATSNGFTDPRLVEDRPLELHDDKMAELVGETRFYSATYRLFKLPDLETACEDHGQAVIYRGTVPNQPHRLVFDKHHVFETGRAVPVCGNSWRMLHGTRFAHHFEFIGDCSRHFGLFEGCGETIPFDRTEMTSQSGSCC